MEFTQSETRINLVRSFAGESQARTRYTVYAGQARQQGLEWVARVFEETAANEAAHAEAFLKMLKKLEGCAENIDLTAGYPSELGQTRENLASAAAGETHEHDEIYPAFAEVARREGFQEAARLWMQIARVEGVHANTFRQLEDLLASGEAGGEEKRVVWQCLKCGYTYESTRPCDPCPVCGQGAGWQEGEINRKKVMGKT